MTPRPSSSTAHVPRAVVGRPLSSVLVATLLAVQVLALAPAGARAAEISFRAATSTASGSTTALTLSKPPGTVAGDALVAAISVRGKPNIRQPNEWMLVLKTQLSSTMTQAIYVRVAAASESASWTWTFSKTVAAAGGVTAYAGVDPTSPVDVAKGQTNAVSAQITAPSLTTSAPNDLLVAVFGVAQATTVAPAATLTERYEEAATGSFRVTQAVADERLSAAGATGPRTATAGASGANIGQLVALRAASDPPADTTAPTVTNRTPAAGATGVAMTTNVSATFSENVVGVNGTTFTLSGSDGTSIQATVSYAATTRTATLDPAADLQPDTTYTAALANGIADAAGNGLAPESWTFATASAPPPPPDDTVPPTVTSRSPADGATGVAVGQNVTATFDETVTGVSGQTFTLTRSDGVAVTASVTYATASRTATLDPSADLAAGTTYTAELTSGITDTAGNVLAPTTWTFQTMEASPPPPPPSGSIEFKGSSSGLNSATASLVLPRPSGVAAGDALIAAVTTRGVPIVSAPTGWLQVIATKNETLLQQVVFVRVAEASEPSSYTFWFSKAVSATGGILAYGGVDPVSPIDTAAGAISASSATVTAPSITTNTSNGRLLAFFGIARLSSFTTAEGMAERFDVTGSSSVTYKISSAGDDAALGAAGATGTRSSTAAGAAGNVGQLVALRAAGAPAIADFSGSPLSGIAPLTVSFQDRSTGAPSSWAWDLDGDGSTDSTTQNPTRTYTQPGTYSVRLTITSGTDSDAELKTGYVVVDATPATSPSDPTIVGAGDIADCGTAADAATATLLDGVAGTVYTLGDNVYETGTTAEWNNCYEPTWGRHKARTRPSLGDHDHSSATAAPEYFAYFGAAAGDPSKGYYSYDLGAWHIVVLNTECTLAGGCGASSPQVTWLRADLAANSSRCTLAYWHEPLYSSSKGGAPDAVAFWDALLDDGADVVLSGDAHVYERFATQDDQGNALATGIRQFVVGTGGRSLAGFGTPIANSEVRNSGTHGVLKLTLHEAGYSWQFLPVAGFAFTDSGSAACH